METTAASAALYPTVETLECVEIEPAVVHGKRQCNLLVAVAHAAVVVQVLALHAIPLAGVGLLAIAVAGVLDLSRQPAA